MVDEDELDEIRKKKLENLKDQAGQGEAAEEQKRKLKAKRQAILRQNLTEDARDRLGRLRVGYPDFAKQVEDQLIRLAQSGRLQGRKIDDDTLKEILQKLNSSDRDIDIKRR